MVDLPEKPPLTIQPETRADIPSVRLVNLAAFGQPEEADLVDRIRSRSAETLSLVATLEEVVVGHIFFSPVIIVGPEFTTQAIGLGPMAVLPDRQRQGIGSALVRHGLEALQEAGHRIVIVLGHREFYPRFGFRPALDYELHWEHEVDPAYFMALELQCGALAEVSGVVSYLPEFSEV
jgi:putative acetyltransferase